MPELVCFAGRSLKELRRFACMSRDLSKENARITVVNVETIWLSYTSIFFNCHIVIQLCFAFELKEAQEMVVDTIMHVSSLTMERDSKLVSRETADYCLSNMFKEISINFARYHIILNF